MFSIAPLSSPNIINMGNTITTVDVTIEKSNTDISTDLLEIPFPSCVGSGIISLLKQCHITSPHETDVRINGMSITTLGLESAWKSTFNQITVRDHPSEEERREAIRLWYKFLYIRSPDYADYTIEVFLKLEELLPRSNSHD